MSLGMRGGGRWDGRAEAEVKAWGKKSVVWDMGIAGHGGKLRPGT